jgi:hypothetical protein
VEAWSGNGAESYLAPQSEGTQREKYLAALFTNKAQFIYQPQAHRRHPLKNNTNGYINIGAAFGRKNCCCEI